MRRETAILRIDKVKGCVFVNQYLVVKFLGRGACGKVFLCLNTHDLCLYAMKVCAPLWEALQLQSLAAQHVGCTGSHVCLIWYTGKCCAGWLTPAAPLPVPSGSTQG